MWILPVILLVIIVLILWEYRIRKPDQFILFESAGEVKKRKARFYPRHFSLALPATTYALSLKVETEARGKLPIIVSLVVTIAASVGYLSALIRVGGWKKDAIAKAGKELEILFQSAISEFCEKSEIEDLSTEALNKHLSAKPGRSVADLGIDVLSLTIQSIDPVDDEIRVAATKAKIEADEKIALAEHDLELKRYKLKEAQLVRENDITNQKMKEDLKRREMQLNFDKKEVELLSKNPELMVLSPQLTRLAEASQNLKNARTVVSLSPQQASQGGQIMDMIQDFSLSPASITGGSDYGHDSGLFTWDDKGAGEEEVKTVGGKPCCLKLKVILP
jgi:hypothetical protein